MSLVYVLIRLLVVEQIGVPVADELLDDSFLFSCTQHDLIIVAGVECPQL